MAGVITLLTDFGGDDPYVAELKAAIMRQWFRFPELTAPPWLVDLAHTIPPGDITAARWFLARVHRQFPPGCVHLAVVDPGVGTARPIVAVRAQGQLFVAPGNGLLGFLASTADLQIIRLDNALYHGTPAGDPAAATFQGRDVMAPVAAQLAAGVPVSQVGSAGVIADLLGAADGAAGHHHDADRLGTVVWVDRFGNAITDVPRASTLGEQLNAGATLQLGSALVRGPLRTFGAARLGQPFWYWGSGGMLEAALREQSGAARYGWRPGLALERPAP